MHGWTWRELTRDRPSISIPDDHDVYQGNIWGEAAPRKQTTQEAGGYNMPAAVGQRRPPHADLASPRPVGPDAVQAGDQRLFRAADLRPDQLRGARRPAVQVRARGQGAADRQPRRSRDRSEFDPKTADVPGLQLLGDRQMRFLREWAADWRGAEMKAVISQTIFTAMATTHGSERTARRRLRHQRLAADRAQRRPPRDPQGASPSTSPATSTCRPSSITASTRTRRGRRLRRAGREHRLSPLVGAAKPGENRAAGVPENTGDFLDTSATR